MAEPDVASARNTLHPPKPVLTFRVGVTGHRPKPEYLLPPEAQRRVDKLVHYVFEMIDAALSDAHEENRDFYHADPHSVRLVSGLAEGADQAAAGLRPPAWALDAILPFPVDTYRKDFERSAADETRSVVPEFEVVRKEAYTVLQLPDYDDPAERDRGYARLGNFLVRQIDLLVAVWNGKQAEGAGGTADVVRQAVRVGVPVVWIPTMAAVTSHNFFARLITGFGRDGSPEAPAADCTQGLLAAAVATIVSVPKDALHCLNEIHCEETSGPGAEVRLKIFLQERWPRRSHYVIYDLFKRLVERKKPRLMVPIPHWHERSAEWDPFFEGAPAAKNEDAPAAKDLKTRLRESLLPRYIWADQLAVDFANKYRTAYILCYLLAALAVGIGVFAGLFAHPSGGEIISSWKAVAITIECWLLLSVGALYWKGKKQRWHEKWLEYRALAERLRDSRFLAYLGEYGRIQPATESQQAPSSWYLWYLRATIRELGLPNAVLDGAYQDRLLRAIETHVVIDQLDYHYPNARTLAKMDWWLRWGARWSFYIVLWVIFLFLLMYASLKMSLVHDPTLAANALIAGRVATFLAVFLPALSAAFAGIRETGDFEGFAQRSERTARDLEELRRGGIPVARKIVSLDETANVLFDAAQILTEDLATWQALYGRKRLDLRA